MQATNPNATAPAAGPSAAGSLPRAVLAVVGTASFMTTLGTGLINVANPSIRAYFDATLVQAGWVVTSYLLAICALLLIFGRLGDVLGYRRLFVVGLIGFAAASLLCALAGEFLVLIAGRLAQGLFAAILMSIGPALISTTFPPQERGRALGVMGTLTYLGLSAGPLIGGALVSRFGWRAVFLCHLPIAAVALYLMRAIPRTSQAAPAANRQRIDAPSAVLWAVGLSCMLFALGSGERDGWTDPRVLGLFGATVAAMVIFVLRQRWTAHPLISGALFKNRVFRNSTIAAFLLYAVSFIMMFILPFSLQGSWSLSPASIGLVMTVMPGVMVVIAPLSGTLADRMGSRVPATIGMVVLAGANVGIGYSGQAHAMLPLLGSLAAFGVGAGLFTTANNSAILGNAPRTQQGTASAILAVSRTVGMTTGVALGGAMLASLHASSGSEGQALVQTFLVGAVLSAIGAVFSWSRAQPASDAAPAVAR